MYRINLNKSYHGEYLGVQFAGGQGETKSEYLAKRFTQKGYDVELLPVEPPTELDPEDAPPEVRPTKKVEPSTQSEIGEISPLENSNGEATQSDKTEEPPVSEIPENTETTEEKSPQNEKPEELPPEKKETKKRTR